MNLTRDNLVLIAAKCYNNPSCISMEEFEEDLNTHKYVKKLAKRMSKGNSSNIRLLTNHVICFTNNFEIQFAKKVLLMDTTPKESAVIKSVLLYLGFLDKYEYETNELDLETLKLLKDMDNGR